MKKLFVLLLALMLCAGLCACGGNIPTIAGGGEEASVTLPTVTLPTIPEPVTIPPQPTEEAEVTTEAAEESTDPTGETYPWEAEFDETGYQQFQGELSDVNGVMTGTCITWAQNVPWEPARILNVYNNGDIEDTYYGYPDSDVPSHQIIYRADGSYLEQHFLNDGYYNSEEDMFYWGTIVYIKSVQADGSYWEQISNDDGIMIYDIYAEASGYYLETYYFESGSIHKETFNDPATGEYRFEERMTNGLPRKRILSNSVTGDLQEQESYDNGSLKYIKSQNKDFLQELRYDESGFCTYFHQKDASGELELISDETGKLVSYIWNGEAIDDPALLEQSAAVYNFRRN